MPNWDDDDRAYHAAYDAGDLSGDWYPDWDGPSRDNFLGELPDPIDGAFEDWVNRVRALDSEACDTEPDFPDINTSDFPDF